MAHSYYKYSSQTKTGGFVIIIVALTLLFGAALFLMQKKDEYTNLYFVEMGVFSNYNDAQKLSTTIKQQAGAGYIYFDTSYHVLANFYFNKSDAEKVCENLIPHHPSAKVFTLSIKKLKYNKITSKNQQCLVDFYDSCNDVLSSLSKANIRYDNNTDSLRVYATNLGLILEKLSPSINDMKTNFKEHKYSSLLTYANNINENLNNFDDENYIIDKQKMRYSTIDIAINFYNFFNEL